jgi:uncharacterized OB-fold protein
MDTIDRPPVADGLFRSDPQGPILIGGTCETCSRSHFPQRARCPYCTGTQVRVSDLPRRGKVWSWTTQEYQPKTPYREVVAEPFGGYVLGYVDLPDACIVETRLDVPVVEAAGRCAIGTEVELVLVPFDHEDGRQLSTFAFRPIDARSSS